MFIHSVYFWLSESVTPAEYAQFKVELQKLAGIGTVRHSAIGVPADTDRPVIERSYSYALILGFDDKKGHDDYQEHPVHDCFRNECSRFWTKALIYDVET
jgi:hypothetical protein